LDDIESPAISRGATKGIDWLPLCRSHVQVSNPAASKVSNGGNDMARKGKSIEEIIQALREPEVRLG
jgi:hypothetical protein